MIDEDDVLFPRPTTRQLHFCTSMPDIVTKLTIKTRKNAGQHPSAASIYRAFAHNDA
ncbi:hypothetical protein [Amycolatopsis sp. FDAARGOS 1241]|uniref:hypothetical protein n=1 Tax=Amycolatopsis sp. FDAARGOS 1241 TaxID=2778070 RepID=UPI00194F8D22|nr:hypothetical protein [Amycolatopsis sp. FDAARGOS 1241]QRP42771.1 hypothetical protein I6J71_25165 [Amycolatopsis sp. FDAARGOS 1241]